jgi:membrane associated rhomboid family serine protease
MFLIVPYLVDVPMRRLPWANWALIGLTVVLYPFCLWGGDFTPLGESLMLGGRGPLGWVGHVLVHGGLLHLLGNMLFLWVFGNSVCAKVGNLAFPVVYFGLGLCSGVAAYAVSQRPAVGASGAINGVVGLFAVWYFLNAIRCWYFYWLVTTAGTGTFELSSIWMILLWLAFDVWGAVRGGGGNVGYVAHLAGLGAGLLLGVGLLLTGWVRMDRGERSLLELFGWEGGTTDDA